MHPLDGGITHANISTASREAKTDKISHTPPKRGGSWLRLCDNLGNQGSKHLAKTSLSACVLQSKFSSAFLTLSLSNVLFPLRKTPQTCSGEIVWTSSPSAVRALRKSWISWWGYNSWNFFFKITLFYQNHCSWQHNVARFGWFQKDLHPIKKPRTRIIRIRGMVYCAYWFVWDAINRVCTRIIRE